MYVTIIIIIDNSYFYYNNFIDTNIFKHKRNRKKYGTRDKWRRRKEGIKRV